MLDVKTVSASIHATPEQVYAFVRDGNNLPKWAHGVGKHVQSDGDAWIAEGPLGRARIKFAPTNQFGVLDHDVTLPNGTTVHNPLRVMPNGANSTVSFTLFRLAGVTSEAFAADEKAVTEDLARLKSVLEA